MIWDLILCGNNLTCHWRTLTNKEESNDPAMVRLCSYFKENKIDLPDYCYVPANIEPPPRRRSEF